MGHNSLGRACERSALFFTGFICTSCEHRYQVGQRREIRRKRYRVHGAKTGESAGTIAVPCRSCTPGLARDMKTPPEGGALEHRQMGSNWTYRTSLATPFGRYPRQRGAFQILTARASAAAPSWLPHSA